MHVGVRVMRGREKCRGRWRVRRPKKCTENGEREETVKERKRSPWRECRLQRRLKSAIGGKAVAVREAVRIKRCTAPKRLKEREQRESEV